MTSIMMDIDECLANFCLAFHRLLCSINPAVRPVADDFAPEQWDWFTLYGATQEDVATAWAYIGDHPFFWSTLQPMPGAREAIHILNLLQDSFDIYFVTHRTPNPGAKHATEMWLRLMGYVNPTVVVTSEKGQFCRLMNISLAVDDNATFAASIRELSPGTRLFMPAYAHNEGVAEEPDRLIRRPLDRLVPFLKGLLHVGGNRIDSVA